MARFNTSVLRLELQHSGFNGTERSREWYGNFLARISCFDCKAYDTFDVAWPPQDYSGEPAKSYTAMQNAAWVHAGEVAVALGVCSHVDKPLTTS